MASPACPPLVGGFFLSDFSWPTIGLRTAVSEKKSPIGLLNIIPQDVFDSYIKE
jgi:hypothetical protein